MLSRDGKALAFLHDRQVQLLSLTPDGRALGSATDVGPEPLGVSGLAWTPDGTGIVYVTWKDRSLIRRIDVRPRTAPRDVGRVDGELDSLAATSGAELLGAVAFHETSYWTVRLRSPGPRPIAFRDLPWNVGAARVSTDGARFLYSIPRGASSAVFISDLKGSGARQIFSVSGRLEQLSWSPDGQRFAMIGVSGGAQLEPSRLFIASGLDASPQQVPKQFENIYATAWSHDGKALFVAAASDGRDMILKLDPRDDSLVHIADVPTMSLEVSADDGFLYLTQRPFSLVRIPVTGGAVERVADGVLQSAVGKDGVYILRQDSKPPSAEGLNLYRVSAVAGAPSFVGHVGFLPSSMQLSSNAELVYLRRDGPLQQRIMVVSGAQ